MGDVVAASSLFSAGHCLRFGAVNVKGKLIKKQQRPCAAKAMLSSKQSKQNKEPLTFHFRFNIDAPFYESPQATFDQYLEDEQRVFKAIFPDTEKIQLNKEKWRIRMPALNVLFLSFYLVLNVNFRRKSMGEDYPAHVPQHISKILELDITRWELLGPPAKYHPDDLSLTVKGTIFSDKKGTQRWLRTIFDINLSFLVPPLLAGVPVYVMRSITDSVVKTVMDDVKVNAILILADYDTFKREKLQNVV